MNFVDPVFLLFFPGVLLVHRFAPAGLRWMVLLAASLFFYAWHNVWLLGLLLTTIGVSYGCAIGMEQAKTLRRKRLLLVLELLFCFGSLFVFKYLDFALDGLFAIGRIFGLSGAYRPFDLILPMGISFYVFQTASYTIDVYRGTVPAERHLGHYALFVTFFPQLVAGPIERPGDLLPQLKDPVFPDPSGICQALTILIRGFGKKILIADLLAVYVDHAYGDVACAGGAALLAATALFGLQIYCDFSGYSDIAQGCAGLMGIRLRENFRRPYAARSFRDFWRRWHLSLTTWFTDYIYIPLGGSRRGLARQCRNTMTVFLISGLWHGADLTFLIWGGLHGLYLVAETLLLRGRSLSRTAQALYRILTLGLVCFAWIFFRADSLEDALLVLTSIFTGFRPGTFLTGLGMAREEVVPVLLAVLLLPRLEQLPALLPASRDRSGMQRQCRTILTYFLLTTAMVLCRFRVLTQHGQTAFLYFQF